MDKMKIFNTNVEAGLRSITLLNAIYPKPMDFDVLLKFDFILIYSGDFEGPASLHPKLPNTKGELAVRRNLVREGISLMKRFGMIQATCKKGGIFYSATEEVEPFLRLMKSEYTEKLKENSIWCANNIECLKGINLNALFKD